ncbi:MAG: Ig-like domain-containing protein, partial [Chloroflexi bacterium]|nr:Ig-like domain-containing protein [Chloroflexota bacterium]
MKGNSVNGSPSVTSVSPSATTAGAATTTFVVTINTSGTTANGDASSTLGLSLKSSALAAIKTASDIPMVSASPTGAVESYILDTTPPSFSVAYAPTSPVKAGQVVLTITASEALSSPPTISINQPGTTDIAAAPTTGTGPYTYTYTVATASGTTFSDGTATVSVTGTDLAGNSGTSVTSGSSFVIDTTAPTVTGVTSSSPSGAYSVGNTVAISVTFSENITSTGSSSLLLETGTTDTAATCAPVTASATLSCTYTVAAGDTSTHLDYQSTTALSGTIKDVAGNAATLTLPALGASALYVSKTLVIDTAAPTVTGITTSTSGGSYKAGAVIPISVAFSEAITSTGESSLLLETGTPATAATCPAVTASTTLSCTYIVVAGNTSSHLDYKSKSALAGTIRDVAGNAATLTLPDLQGSSLFTTQIIVIDTTAPSAPAGLALTAATDTGTSATDGTTNVTSVVVTGSAEAGATVTLKDAGSAISGASGPATNGTFTISATLAPGTHTITATATDSAGNVSSVSSVLSVTIDQTAPTVTGVNSTLANGSYNATKSVPITVTFTEPVTVVTTGGTPQLTLRTGSTATTPVNYTSGSGTTVLTFTYTVGANDTSADLDYAATTSLGLNGGSIKDAAGNDATLTLASPGAAGSLGNAKALIIDTTAPTVTSIVRANSAAALTRGTSAPVFTVTTSESVTGLVKENFSVNRGAGIGGTAPTIASVTGSGTSWTVTLGVTGTTGN